MVIKVTLPTISMMKMELSPHIELDLPCEGIDLPTIKTKIFYKAWEILARWSPTGIHDVPEDVVLRDEYDIEITDDAQLKDRLSESLNFSAVFRKHRQNPNNFFRPLDEP